MTEGSLWCPGGSPPTPSVKRRLCWVSAHPSTQHQHSPRPRSRARKTKQKDMLQPRLGKLGQPTDLRGGRSRELWPAANRGGVNSWRHTQIRGQKGKASSAAQVLSSGPFFWPLAQFQGMAGPHLGLRTVTVCVNEEHL